MLVAMDMTLVTNLNDILSTLVLRSAYLGSGNAVSGGNPDVSAYTRLTIERVSFSR